MILQVCMSPIYFCVLAYIMEPLVKDVCSPYYRYVFVCVHVYVCLFTHGHVYVCMYVIIIMYVCMYCRQRYVHYGIQFPL